MKYLIKCTKSKVPINIRIGGETFIIPAKTSPAREIEMDKISDDVKKLKDNKIISLVELS